MTAAFRYLKMAKLESIELNRIERSRLVVWLNEECSSSQRCWKTE